MGGSVSLPSPPAPITIVRPKPGQEGAIDGLSISTAQGCARCVLTVPQGVSTSSATIYREQGDISLAECSKLSNDIQRVRGQEMTINEFKEKARNREYSTTLYNGHCAQLTFLSLDSDNIDELLKGTNFRASAIRRLTETGGYSAGTKMFIHPSIPFHVKFNGEDITVSTMTLFHPSPIRVNNIQHDAVLTLGDIGSDAKVLMIPLAGSIRPGTKGKFISKLTSFIPGILQPHPATGLYPRIEVPTGSDWNLSMLFPGSPQGGETVVDSGYYVWYTAPPVEKYLKETLQTPVNVRGTTFTQTTYVYDWKPIGPVGRQIIMLSDPIEIGSFDLQSIKMLPPTPTELPPPLMQTLVYHTPTKCTSKEGFANELDIDKCDPLANIPTPPSKIDVDTMGMWLLGLISAIAVFIGVYYAVKLLPGWSPYIKKAADKVGEFLAKAGSRIEVATAPMGQAMTTMKTGIDTKLGEAKQKMEKRREDSRRRARSQERETELKRQEAIKGFQKAEADAAAEKAATAALEERKLDARMKAKPEQKPEPEPEVKAEEVSPATAVTPEPIPSSAPTPPPERKKPSKTEFEQEPKPVSPPPKPFDRSQMTAEQLRREARAAGTGLLDPEINAKRKEEAEAREEVAKQQERELRQELLDINVGKIKSDRQKEEAAKRIEEAKQKIEDLKKKAREEAAKIQKEKVELLQKGFTKEQLAKMKADIEVKKAEREAEEALARAQKQIEDTEKQFKEMEATQRATERVEAAQARPPPVKGPTIPPHMRGMQVREGTKKKTAETPAPKPATPPSGPVNALQKRVDEQVKKGVTGYRSPVAFGSTQGRWRTKEERDLADARARLGQSTESVRRQRKVGGRGRKRKNINI